jgi:diphthine synthase
MRVRLSSDVWMQESFYGRPVIIADREMVESSSDEILAGADKVDIAFLVVGDPFGYTFALNFEAILTRDRATTHTDLSLRARTLNIQTQTVHNASILTGVSVAGLSLYHYGQTTSMVFFTDEWRPQSFYDRLLENHSIGLHSLILLDIKVKEMDMTLLARTGKVKYDPPRYMSVAQCVSQMLEVEEARKGGICGPDRLVVGIARVGSEDQVVKVGTLAELKDSEVGKPLHSVVLMGKRTGPIEKEFLRDYAVDGKTFDEAWEKGGYGE